MAIEYETLEEEKEPKESPSFDGNNLDSSMDSTTSPPPPPAPVTDSIFTFTNPQKSVNATELVQSAINVLQLQQPYDDYCQSLQNTIVTSNKRKNSRKNKVKIIPAEKYYNLTKKLIVVRKLRIITFHADCTNNHANIHSGVDINVILSLMTKHLLQNSIFSTTLSPNVNTQTQTNIATSSTKSSSNSVNNSINSSSSRRPSVIALALPKVLPLDQFLNMKKVQYVIEWTTTIIYFFIKDKLFYAKLALDNAITPKSTCYTPRSVSVILL